MRIWLESLGCAVIDEEFEEEEAIV